MEELRRYICYIKCAVDTIDGRVVSDYDFSEDEGYVEICGWASSPCGEPFDYVLLLVGDRCYQAPRGIDARPDVVQGLTGVDDTYGFTFVVAKNYIAIKDIHFVGIRSGERYDWDVFL